MSETVLTSSAVLLMDYQVGLCEAGDACLAPPLAAEITRRGTLAASRALLEAAREQAACVIHVRLAFDETYELRTNRTARFDRYPETRAMLVGSPEAAAVTTMSAAEGELVVIKGCVDPFVGTPLRDILAARGIDTVVMAGVATNLVVESAARHAADSGLQPYVVEDACASFSAEMHHFAIANTLPLFATVVGSVKDLT
jgi:nicotinamidase-related amidase